MYVNLIALLNVENNIDYVANLLNLKIRIHIHCLLIILLHGYRNMKPT